MQRVLLPARFQKKPEPLKKQLMVTGYYKLLPQKELQALQKQQFLTRQNSAVLLAANGILLLTTVWAAIPL